MCQTKGEHDRSLSIHLSLPFSPSTPLPTPLSALSFSLSPLCSCLCLPLARVWRTQTKECRLPWRKSKGLGSREVVEGWPGVRVGKALSKLWLSIVVFWACSLPRPSPLSPISFNVHVGFSVFFNAVRARDGDCREKWGNATDVTLEAVRPFTAVAQGSAACSWFLPHSGLGCLRQGSDFGAVSLTNC